MTPVVLRVAFAPVSLILCAALLSACGAKKSATDLRVSYITGALGKQSAHLKCEPPGGIAHAAGMCRRLNANPHDYLGRDKICSPLTTVSVEVEGSFRGRKVSEGYDCDTGYVDRWVALLHFKPTTAG